MLALFTSCKKEAKKLPLPDEIALSQHNISLLPKDDLQLNILNSNDYPVNWNIKKGKGLIDNMGKYTAPEDVNDHTLVEVWLKDHPNIYDSCWISTVKNNTDTYIKDLDFIKHNSFKDASSCLIDENTIAFALYERMGYSSFNIFFLDEKASFKRSLNFGYGSCKKIKYDENKIIAIGASGIHMDTAAIIKTSVTGELSWKTKLNGSESNDFAITKDNKYLVIIDSNILVQVNEIGVVEWEKQFGEPSEHYADSFIQITESGDILIVRCAWLDHQYETKLYKLNSKGESLGYDLLTKNLECTDFKIDSNGDVYLSGLGLGYEHGWNYYLLKLDSNHNIIYEKSYGLSSYDYCSKMMFVNEELVLIGWTGSDNVAICKVKKNGELVYWKEYIEGYAHSAVVTKELNIQMFCNNRSDVRVIRTDMYGNIKP